MRAVRFLLPSGEKVSAGGARMKGRVQRARRLAVSLGPASPSSVMLRMPPSPPRGEGK